MAASYRAVAGWLVHDIVRTLRLRLLALACLGVAVIFARIATYGGFLLYLRSAVSDEPAMLPWIGVSLPEVGIEVWAPTVLAAGLVLGALIYAEVQTRVALSSSYALDAMERAIDTLAASDFEARGRNLTYREKVRLLGSDSWAMMRAAFPMLTTILPVNQLIVATALLVAMSWEMALVIVAIGIVYIAPFFVLNRRVARASHQRQMSMPAFKGDVAEALDAIAYPQYRAANAQRARRILLDGAALREAIGSYRVIRTTSGAVTFLNSVALALVMLVLMLYVSRAGTDIVVIGIVAYGVVLLHAYAAANTITSQIAAFNRFFPQFRRYVAVLAQDKQKDGTAAVRRPLRLRLGPGKSLPGSLSSLVLTPNMVLLAIQPRRLSGRTLDEWLTGIDLGAARRDAVFFSPPASDLPDLPLHQIGGAGLEPLLALSPVASCVAELPQGLETRWRAITAAPPTLALALAVAPALAAAPPPGAILVDGRSWNVVSEEVRAQFRDLFAGTAWLIAGGAPTADVTHFLFADESGPIGMGDRAWGLRTMQKMTERPVRVLRTAATMDYEDLDEEMD